VSIVTVNREDLESNTRPAAIRREKRELIHLSALNVFSRKDSQLNYYQWTPFIILLMALFFYLPRLIWRALSVRSGIDLQDIVEAADDTKKIKEVEGDHERLVKYIVDTIDMYVDDARRQMDAENRQASLFRKMLQLICCMTGKFLGNYFITLYIFIK
jgi:innexin